MADPNAKLATIKQHVLGRLLTIHEPGPNRRTGKERSYEVEQLFSSVASKHARHLYEHLEPPKDDFGCYLWDNFEVNRPRALSILAKKADIPDRSITHRSLENTTLHKSCRRRLKKKQLPEKTTPPSRTKKAKKYPPSHEKLRKGLEHDRLETGGKPLYLLPSNDRRTKAIYKLFEEVPDRDAQSLLDRLKVDPKQDRFIRFLKARFNVDLPGALIILRRKADVINADGKSIQEPLTRAITRSIEKTKEFPSKLIDKVHRGIEPTQIRKRSTSTSPLLLPPQIILRGLNYKPLTKIEKQLLGQEELYSLVFKGPLRGVSIMDAPRAVALAEKKYGEKGLLKFYQLIDDYEIEFAKFAVRIANNILDFQRQELTYWRNRYTQTNIAQTLHSRPELKLARSQMRNSLESNKLLMGGDRLDRPILNRGQDSIQRLPKKLYPFFDADDFPWESLALTSGSTETKNVIEVRNKILGHIGKRLTAIRIVGEKFVDDAKWVYELEDHRDRIMSMIGAEGKIFESIIRNAKAPGHLATVVITIASIILAIVPGGWLARLALGIVSAADVAVELRSFHFKHSVRSLGFIKQYPNIAWVLLAMIDFKINAVGAVEALTKVSRNLLKSGDKLKIIDGVLKKLGNDDSKIRHALETIADSEQALQAARKADPRLFDATMLAGGAGIGMPIPKIGFIEIAFTWFKRGKRNFAAYKREQEALENLSKAQWKQLKGWWEDALELERNIEIANKPIGKSAMTRKLAPRTARRGLFNPGLKGLDRLSASARKWLNQTLKDNPTKIKSFEKAGDDVIAAINRFHKLPEQSGFRQVVQTYVAGGNNQTGMLFVLRFIHANFKKVPKDFREMLFELSTPRAIAEEAVAKGVKPLLRSRSYRIIDLKTPGVRYEFKSVNEIRKAIALGRKGKIGQLEHDLVLLLAQAPDKLGQLKWVFDKRARMSKTYIIEKLSGFIKQGVFRNDERLNSILAQLEDIVVVW